MKHTLRLRTAAAAVLALAGGAALTACGSSDGTDAAAAVPAAAHASPNSSAAPAGSAASAAPGAKTAGGAKATSTDARPASRSQAAGAGTTGTTGTARTGGTGTSGSTTTTGAGHTSHASGTSGSTAQGLDAPCTTAGTRIAVQKVAEPINHLLLTVTNTGSTRCAAFGAPDLGFNGDQAVTRILRDSVPQAVVELEPGDSAYAAIGLSAGDGSGAHGRTVTSLRVQFQDSDLGPAGPQKTIALPAGTYKDDTAFVTYWQTDPSAALAY